MCICLRHRQLHAGTGSLNECPCLAGRQRGAFVDRPRSAAAAPGAGKDPLIDALAERGEEEEALCAVRFETDAVIKRFHVEKRLVGRNWFEASIPF